MLDNAISYRIAEEYWHPLYSHYLHYIHNKKMNWDIEGTRKLATRFTHKYLLRTKLSNKLF